MEFFTSVVDIYFCYFFAIEFADSRLDIDLGSCHIYHSSIDSSELSISTLISNDEFFDDGIEGIHKGEIILYTFGQRLF
jgi:hypothetical protein